MKILDLLDKIVIGCQGSNLVKLRRTPPFLVMQFSSEENYTSILNFLFRNKVFQFVCFIDLLYRCLKVEGKYFLTNFVYPLQSGFYTEMFAYISSLTHSLTNVHVAKSCQTANPQICPGQDSN